MPNYTIAIQSVPQRRADTEALLRQLPEGTDVYEDTDGDYLAAYFGLLRRYAGRPLVRIEDDVQLCDGFTQRLTAAIGLYPNSTINFFYLRGKNKSLRPERHGGADFCMGQCLYLPGLATAGMVKLYDRGLIPNPKRHGGKTGVGFVTSDFLVHVRQKYILWYPCLVQHREVPTVIPGAHPARHAHRQTKHFADDVLSGRRSALAVD